MKLLNFILYDLNKIFSKKINKMLTKEEQDNFMKEHDYLLEFMTKSNHLLEFLPEYGTTMINV